MSVRARIGETLGGRFVLESTAGVGGMGAVYRARDLRTGAAAAVKVMTSSAALATERFARETRVLAELSHPGIVRYLAHGTSAEGDPWLAMDWLDGEDLATRLARQPLTLRESVALVLRASEVLGTAHARGVVHRDVKPANLFLPAGDVSRLTVLDFGIARSPDASELTGTGVLLGTVGYMAPEQVRGERAVGPAADVFSLACVLYECVAGRALFEGEHALAVAVKILIEETPDLRDARDDVPAELAELVARALAREPSQRPANGAEFARALRALGAIDGAARSRAPTKGALVGADQRLLSVVVAAPNSASDRERTADPEELRARLKALREALGPHGAQVEVVGGAVVAIIAGGEMPMEQCRRAAQCALALRERLPSAALVLATGRGVVEGAQIVGEVVNRAAALLRSGTGPGVRIDELTTSLLNERFDVEVDRGTRWLRGAGGGARPLLARDLPCVGRERELDLLRATFDEVVEERVARVVLVTAPAGAGKSRLASEFSDRLINRAPDAVTMLVGRGDALAPGSAFGVLAPALRRLFGLLDGEPPEVQRARLREHVARRVAPTEVPRVAEFLGELANVPFAPDESLQLRAARRDPVLMGDQMRAAWVELLAAECEARPVVLVVEDLHWGDLPSVSFIDSALRALHESRFFVLALGRPDVHERFPRIWSQRSPTEIALGGLARRAAEQLARRALGPAAPNERVAALVARADGNAFYLEELLRAESEGRGGVLPETVLGMVQARLAMLGRPAQQALRAASVYGERFCVGGVAALLGDTRPRHELDELLRELSAREVLERRPAAFAGETEYAFRHGLLCDASYALLPPRDAALGHRLAAEWLERAGERDALTLAAHYERGGEPERSGRWLLRAAEAALEGDDYAAVIARSERGSTALEAGALRGELRLLAGKARRWLGELDAAALRLEEALEELVEGDASWFDAAAELANVTGRRGDSERVRALMGRVRDARPSDADARAAQVVALQRAAFVSLVVMDPVVCRALAREERVPEAPPELERDEPLAAGQLASLRTLEAQLRGDAREAHAYARAAVRAFERAGDRRDACIERRSVAFAKLFLGEFAESEALLRETNAEAARLGLAGAHALGRVALARCLGWGGALDEALDELLSLLGGPGVVAPSPPWLFAQLELARVFLARGTNEASAEAARALVERAPDRSLHRGACVAAHAAALLACGQSEEARARAAEAVAWLEERGGLSFDREAIWLTHAEALHAAGDEEGARASVQSRARALRKYAEANFADAGRRARYEGAVPVHARVFERCRAWGVPVEA